MRIIYIGLGSLMVGIGTLGVFLPGLPTTVFLLAASWCFVKGSPRLNSWLVNHRLFGKYIKSYLENKGMTRKNKVAAILVMWLMIVLSALFALTSPTARIILAAAGAAGTVSILFVRTVQPEEKYGKN